MPTYEFRCRSCDGTFAVSRPMARSSEPASCPQGHDDTSRLLTIGALAGRAAGAATVAAPASSGPAGGCCGGGCCG